MMFYEYVLQHGETGLQFSFHTDESRRHGRTHQMRSPYLAESSRTPKSKAFCVQAQRGRCSPVVPHPQFGTPRTLSPLAYCGSGSSLTDDSSTALGWYCRSRWFCNYREYLIEVQFRGWVNQMQFRSKLLQRRAA